MDGLRARIFDSARFQASKELPELISSMQRFRIYVTSSERNYGVYNMRFTASDGLSYTAFFMVRKKKGRFDPATKGDENIPASYIGGGIAR
jgi:PhoPQ-activated pathogenicity-related protein